MKSKVYVVYTGGTIGMRSTPQGLVPASRAELVQHLEGYGAEEGIEWELEGLTDERGQEVAAREAQLNELKKRMESDGPMAPMAFTRARSIIDTSFDMDIGETVVVGTSRLKDTGKDSGRALIALLTAVPKNGTPPKQE